MAIKPEGESSGKQITSLSSFPCWLILFLLTLPTFLSIWLKHCQEFIGLIHHLSKKCHCSWWCDGAGAICLLPKHNQRHLQDAGFAEVEEGVSWGCQHLQPPAPHLVHWLPVFFYFLFAPSFSDAPRTRKLLGNFRRNWELLGMNLRTGERDGSVWLHLAAPRDWCGEAGCKQMISLKNPEQRGPHQSELMAQLFRAMPAGPSG